MGWIKREFFTVESRAQPSMPRRFNLGTAMAVVSLHAALLGSLRWAGATTGQLAAAAAFCIFLTGIVLAQMFLFHGKGLRKAAILAGIVIGPMIWAAMFAFEHWLAPGPAGERAAIETTDVIRGAIMATIFGAAGGLYLGMGVEVVVLCRTFITLGRDLEGLRKDVERDARAAANGETNSTCDGQQSTTAGSTPNEADE